MTKLHKNYKFRVIFLEFVLPVSCYICIDFGEAWSFRNDDQVFVFNFDGSKGGQKKLRKIYDSYDITPEIY